MRAKVEVDVTNQDFRRIRPSERTRGILSGVRRYHQGVFDDGTRQFDILLLNTAEARHLIPVNDITDPDKQLHQVGLSNASMKFEIPIGFVQKTEGAIKVLKKKHFNEELPNYLVVPDPIIADLML